MLILNCLVYNIFIEKFFEFQKGRVFMENANVMVVRFNEALMAPVVEGVTFEIGDSNKELAQFYKLIHTDIVEHLSVKINKRKYDLWFDEEGKFKRNAPLYPLSYNGKIYDVIMGNIVVTKSRNGRTEGIPDKEWDSLKKALEEKAYEALREVSKMINK